MSPPGGCRLGLLALGDSITNGHGESALGVPSQSWALWLARALELPYSSHASDGARAQDVVSAQLPRVRGDYDLGCVYIGVNDTRSVDWDPGAYERDLEAIVGFLAARSARVLALTIPLDLGRPVAGPKVPAANAIIGRVAAGAGAIVADLSSLRGWPLVLPDAVHPTALGQLEIAGRAAAALAANGVAVPVAPAQLAAPDRRVRRRARHAVTYARLVARDLVRRRVEAASRRLGRTAS